MDITWLYALGSVLVISLVSLIGLFTFGLKQKFLEKILLLLVSFSAGALFGDAFIHLIPEALEGLESNIFVGIGVIAGIILFFVLEKIIHWRHCHVPTSKHHPHPVAIMNLIGDGVHNFIDGLVIGASYLVSIHIGITTTIAVVLHEIPQEIGDFGVLLHGGFTKGKALLMNFGSALISLVGTILGLLIGSRVEQFSLFLLPITAGGFIYIAGSDLIPELHKETIASKSIMQLVSIIFGILLMLALILLE